MTERRVPLRVVGTLMLGTTLNPLNSTMIALALVDVRHDFAISVAAAGSLVIAFYVVGAFAQPTMGRLADRFGPRRTFVSGLAISGIVCATAPLADSLGWLVLARAALAVGTAVAFPSALATIRNLAGDGPTPAGTMGALSIAANAMAALGPVVGGVAVAIGGWQATFLVNLPLIAGGIVLGLVWLPRGRTVAGPPAPAGTLSLLRLGALRSVYARFFAVTLAFYGVVLGLPIWLEEARGLSTETVGLMLAPVAGLSMVTTPLAARLIHRRSPASSVALGAACVVAGALPMLAYGGGTPVGVIVVAGAILGAGLGFANLGLQTAMYEAAPPARIGWASGLFQTCRYVGAVAAGLIMGAAFAGGVGSGGIRLIGAVTVGLAAATVGISLGRRPVHRVS